MVPNICSCVRKPSFGAAPGCAACTAVSAASHESDSATISEAVATAALRDTPAQDEAVGQVTRNTDGAGRGCSCLTCVARDQQGGAVSRSSSRNINARRQLRQQVGVSIVEEVNGEALAAAGESARRRRCAKADEPADAQRLQLRQRLLVRVRTRTQRQK